MRRHLLDLSVLLALSTIACTYIAIDQPGFRNVAIYSYVLIAGGTVMLAIVSSFGDALHDTVDRSSTRPSSRSSTRTEHRRRSSRSNAR